MNGTITISTLILGGSVTFAFGIVGKIVFDWLRNGRNGKNGNSKMPSECRDTLKRIENGVSSVRTSQQVAKEQEICSNIYLKEISDSMKEHTKILQKNSTLLEILTGGGGGRQTKELGGGE